MSVLGRDLLTRCIDFEAKSYSSILRVKYLYLIVSCKIVNLIFEQK